MWEVGTGAASKILHCYIAGERIQLEMRTRTATPDATCMKCLGTAFHFMGQRLEDAVIMSYQDAPPRVWTVWSSWKVPQTPICI
jgi:hypothetical protein